MPTPVSIPESVMSIVVAEAMAAFPAECCGWLAGPKGGTAATRARPCKNAQDAKAPASIEGRTAETAYVIAGADLLALNRELDGDEPPQVIYHSHPNGRAYFSDTDRAVATDPWGEGPMMPVQQLVVGVDASGPKEWALFAWDPHTLAFVEVGRGRFA